MPEQERHIDAMDGAVEALLEPLRIRARQVAHALEAELRQALARHRADAPDASHRQRIQERAHSLRSHLQQAVGLGGRAGDLRHHLDRRDSDRDRKPGLLAHRRTQALGHPPCGPEQTFAAGEIEEGLVEGEPLDGRREATEDRKDALRLADVRVGPRLVG